MLALVLSWLFKLLSHVSFSSFFWSFVFKDSSPPPSSLLRAPPGKERARKQSTQQFRPRNKEQIKSKT